jgi:hypothetical protein
LHMRCQVDLGAHEMDAFTDPRQARREHLMAARLQRAPHMTEPVRTTPTSMDQDVHRSLPILHTHRLPDLYGADARIVSKEHRLTARTEGIPDGSVRPLRGLGW